MAIKPRGATKRGFATDRPLKVLHVIPSVGPLRGGPSHAIDAITRALARAGSEIHVATTDDNGPDRLCVPRGRPVDDGVITTWFFPRQTGCYSVSLPLAHWLARHISAFDLVHIHALFSFSSTMAAHYASRRQVPYIVRPMGSLGSWGMSHRRRRLKQISFQAVERRVLAGAAALHFTSELERQEAARIGIKGASFVLPESVDPAVFDPLPPRSAFLERHPELSGKQVILFLSRFDPIKGIDLLLRAFASLQVDFPDTALVLAGSGDRRFEAQLRRSTRDLGIAPHVVWTGFLGSAQKLAALAVADVFVLPSYSENFGIAAAEGLAAGLPVVVTDRVGLSALVHEYGAGLIVPCDAARLAGALERLLSDSRCRKQMGINGRRLVRDRLAPDVMARSLLTLYETALGEERCPPSWIVSRQ